MAKRAIKKVVKHLTTEDTFHFVIYASDVEVVFAAADLTEKLKLRETIRAVKTRGCTNISEGSGSVVSISTILPLLPCSPDLSLRLPTLYVTILITLLSSTSVSLQECRKGSSS